MAVESETRSAREPALPGSKAVWKARAIALGIGLLVAGALAAASWSKLGNHSQTTILRKVISDDSLYEGRAELARAWNPATANPGNRHLPRFPIPERIGSKLFPVSKLQPWDPQTYITRNPNEDYSFQFAEHAGGSVRFRTNSLGMR